MENRPALITEPRRFIRDTVANDYKPEWKIKQDRQLAWLDRVQRECADYDRISSR